MNWYEFKNLIKSGVNEVNENKKKSTKKIITATAVTIGVTALTTMAPLAQVPGVTNHEPNTTIKAAAISKSQVALQYGTLKVAMKGPTGHVYPAGTQVVRHSSTGDSNSNFEENFFLAMVSTGPSPIGGMQPVVAGEINTQYVTITNTVVETVPSDETVILNNITEADYNNGGAFTPATQAQVDKTALNAAVSKAQGILNGDTSKYTDNSVNTMKTALSNAQSIAANSNTTQAQVDSAASTLNSAIKGLQDKPSNQNGQTNGNTPTNKNGQVNENGHWYLYKNGVKQTGMQTIPDQHKTVYYNSNGQMQYGQQKINGHWYLFDKPEQ
ncbi:hypothetical protein FC89_GL002320 [Liquorilactobacillus ghanensis DSM 18630]|uniref:Uncharacterized protein n=1 Tax=Liquorilactobacillus ghanensis DSM 18630 TaxID=1423750 RepID=A0A0R1VFU4_9LACO|nr:hypothetical protein FC89_GL002320 [Liquorilactobacillus ghanensis DSM 18630]